MIKSRFLSLNMTSSHQPISKDIHIISEKNLKNYLNQNELLVMFYFCLEAGLAPRAGCSGGDLSGRGACLMCHWKPPSSY